MASRERGAWGMPVDVGDGNPADDESLLHLGLRLHLHAKLSHWHTKKTCRIYV